MTTNQWITEALTQPCLPLAIYWKHNYIWNWISQKERDMIGLSLIPIAHLVQRRSASLHINTYLKLDRRVLKILLFLLHNAAASSVCFRFWCNCIFLYGWKCGARQRMSGLWSGRRTQVARAPQPKHFHYQAWHIALFGFSTGRPALRTQCT